MRNFIKLFVIGFVFTGLLSCTNVYYESKSLSSIVTPPVVSLECDPSGVMFVRWTPSNDAVSYSISKNGVGLANVLPYSAASSVSIIEGGFIYVDCDIKPGTSYSYTVTANTSTIAAETSPIASGITSAVQSVVTPQTFTALTLITADDIDIKVSKNNLTVKLNKRNSAATYEIYSAIEDPITNKVRHSDNPEFLDPVGTLFNGYESISAQETVLSQAGIYWVLIKEKGLAPGSEPKWIEKKYGQINIPTILSIKAKAAAVYETGNTKAKISWDQILNGTTAIPYSYYHVYRQDGSTAASYTDITSKVTFGTDEEVLEERDPSTGVVTKKGVPAQHYFIDDFNGTPDTSKTYKYTIRVESSADMIDSDKDIVVTLEVK